jgi:hypothetical protein
MSRWLQTEPSVENIQLTKVMAAVVLGTSAYNQKIAAVLEDKTYKKLKKDPTDFTEQKIVLLLKKCPIAEVRQQLRSLGSRPQNIGSHKIYKTPRPRRCHSSLSPL